MLYEAINLDPIIEPYLDRLATQRVVIERGLVPRAGAILKGLLPAGVVLCGGSSQLRGLRELGHSILQLPVRVGAPQSLEGLMDSISDPAYASSAGLLLWGAQLDSLSGDDRRPAMAWQSAFSRLRGWLGPFLPD